MSKAKKKEKDPPPPPPEPEGPGWGLTLRRVLYRPVVLVTMAAVVVGSMFLPKLRELLPDLAEHEAYQLSAKDIQITQPPHWVPHDLAEQVVERAGLPENLSLLDKDLVRTIAEAFALHPWVEEVKAVTKTFPPKVNVQLTYRRPVAMVQVKQGLYPIDDRGVLLPPKDFAPAEARQYPQILEIVSTPQGPAGSDWGDPRVTEAAQLAAELAKVWKKLQLASIVCPRAGQASSTDAEPEAFLLLTAGGSRIVWGRGPASDHPGELTTEQKIGRLEEYATKFGGLDSPQGPFRIDIRHWRDIRRTPLSAGRGGEATGQTRE